MYVKTIGVYPGCDETGITPAAVGAIVALAIIAMCAIGGLLLWFVRSCLHRDPNRQRNRRARAAAAAAAAAARAKTIDLEYGESDIGVPSTGRQSPGSVNLPEPAKLENGRRMTHSRSKSAIPTQTYEMVSSKRLTSDGEFSAVQLEVPTTVLDFAGITVTHEIKIVREDDAGSAHGAGRGDEGRSRRSWGENGSLGERNGNGNGNGSGSGGSGSGSGSGSGYVPGTGVEDLEILGSRGDIESISWTEGRQGHGHEVHPNPYSHAQSYTSNSYSTAPAMASYPALSSTSGAHTIEDR